MTRNNSVTGTNAMFKASLMINETKGGDLGIIWRIILKWFLHRFLGC